MLLENNMETVDKKSLMKKIQMYEFIITEMILYLDTHPHCKEGLKYFNKYKVLLSDAIKEFTEKYGPVSPMGTKAETHWDWVKGHWPWEKEAN